MGGRGRPLCLPYSFPLRWAFYDDDYDDDGDDGDDDDDKKAAQ